MKQIELMKTRTAIIILSIIVLLLMIAVFNFFDKVYQKQTENFPQISVYYKDKEIGKMLVTKSNWTYKGKTKNLDLGIKEITKYDFPEESVVLVGDNNVVDYLMKADFRYKIISINDNLYDADGTIKSYGSGDGDFSKNLQKGMAMQCTNGIGEYVFVFNPSYAQGKVNYAIKLISFDEEQAKIAKNYLNISLNDNNKIEELLLNLKYGKMMNSFKVEGKELIIEYKFHINEDEIKMHNLILFNSIPELETITYSPENKKTIFYELEDEDVQERKEEVEKRVYTREQTDKDDLVNIEHLKKFMEQI